MLDMITLAAKGGTIAENFSQYGGTVTFSGLIIVFAMLILFVFVIAAFGAVMSRATGKPKKAKPAAAPEKKAQPKTAPKASAPAASAVSQDGIDGETVAAISAAVAMMYEGTGKNPVIRSIKPASQQGVRSAWKTAGVLNNTRPF